MVFFLIGCAALWALGWRMKAPRSARWLMIGLLYVAILGITVALPDGMPLRNAVGGSTGEWLAVGGLVALVWAYSVGLAHLRTRVAPENRAPSSDTVSATPNEVELDRYSRHILLREIGGPGQARLRKARVLVVGAGGLGSSALQYLAAAGVGTIGVIDPDSVENSNLQRQVIHTDARIGMPKVFSVAEALRAQNPYVAIRPYHRSLTSDIAADLLEDYDLVLDGSDDPVARYAVNAAAVEAGLPLVSGALTAWEGQVSVFDPSAGAPCYACLFPKPNAAGLAPDCAEGGVLGPLPGVIGSVMAVEAIKVLTGAGQTLHGRLFLYDALWGETRHVAIARRPDCAVCGTGTLEEGGGAA
ncbi:MAG: HesA/MoeB/ThiF family protein [Pseudomonadota bacterium]